MKTIYLVTAYTMYEGSDVVRAFLDKGDAEIFQKLCEEYDKTKPECPEIDETPENDVLWEKYNKADTKWQKHHPAGRDFFYQDSFGIQEVDLY